jgi:hypothetical protein
LKDSAYYLQARLVVRYLPALAAADGFALKGGTAINLFLRDMPRLSVDIDLAHLSREDRAQALPRMREALVTTGGRAEKLIPGLKVRAAGRDDAPKQLASVPGAQIKIEPNPVMRGTVFEPEMRRLSAAAEGIFELSAMVKLVSTADLYAGKLCAALDRGHPRDWFDVSLLLRHGGIDERTRQAFVVYLACHSRPMAELLSPRHTPLAETFAREFEGMARESVSVADLEDARAKLPDHLLSVLSDSERRFLLAIKMGEPNWDLLPIPHIRELPALQWKLGNIETLRRHARKHSDSVARLRKVLGM